MGWEDYQDWSSDDDKDKKAREESRKKNLKNPGSVKICSECGDPLLKREHIFCTTCVNYAHANN